MINFKSTAYEECNQVISFLSNGISSALSNTLVGIYIFGSLSYGDFNPETSDIDLMVILEEPASEAEINVLKTLHKTTETTFPRWAKRIECSYTPREMLPSILPPGARPYYGEGTFYATAPYGNEWIINLYLLRAHGITVVGPAFTQLIKPIAVTDVQEACKRDLLKEWEPKLREPDWLDNPHYQSYLVLNLCRILNTVINGTTLSKIQSAAWVKKEYPEWSGLVQHAERWQYGTKMEQKEQTLEFLRFVLKKV